MERRGWISGRSLAAFAGGASLGVIASRLLPPLLSQSVAALDDARGIDPFQALAEDHRHFTDLLTQMVESQGSSIVHRTQLLARLKRGLAAHALAEEDVIYPLLHDRAMAEAEAARLNAEHGMIKTHLYALERLLSDETAWLGRAAELKALVESHARDEEIVEFPRLRELLDDASIRRIARHVRREKAMIL